MWWCELDGEVSWKVELDVWWSEWMVELDVWWSELDGEVSWMVE